MAGIVVGRHHFLSIPQMNLQPARDVHKVSSVTNFVSYKPPASPTSTRQIEAIVAKASLQSLNTSFVLRQSRRWTNLTQSQDGTFTVGVGSRSARSLILRHLTHDSRQNTVHIADFRIPPGSCMLFQNISGWLVGRPERQHRPIRRANANLVVGYVSVPRGDYPSVTDDESSLPKDLPRDPIQRRRAAGALRAQRYRERHRAETVTVTHTDGTAIVWRLAAGKTPVQYSMICGCGTERVTTAKCIHEVRACLSCQKARRKLQST